MTKQSKPTQSNEVLDPAKLQYISAQGRSYYNLMMEAAAAGAPVDALFDHAGVAALRQITAQAGSTAVQGNRIVPNVIEKTGDRERGMDLYSKLLQERIVLLEGQVDDVMASVAIASLLFLNSEKSGAPKEKIRVHVNSPGGSVLAGLAIYDTMRSIAAPIETIGFGMQASMGSILLVAGDEPAQGGGRVMSLNSKYMIHQPLSGNERSTQQTDLVLGIDFTTRLREDLTDIYVRHTGLNHDFWDVVLERDTWLSAKQAKEMGIIHDIIVGDRKPTLHEEFSHRASKDEARQEKVATLKTEEIKGVINTAAYSDIRPELVVALSKCPEYWTESRKKLEAAKAQKAQPLLANDNAGKELVAAGPAAKAPRRSRARKPS